MDFKNSVLLIIFVGNALVADDRHNAPSTFTLTKKTIHPLAFLVSHEISNDAYFFAAQHYCSFT